MTKLSDAARLLGSKGASKGGKNRMKKLTRKQRQALARKAAQARWGKRREGA